MRYGRNGALVLSLSCAGLIGLLASTATARDEDFVQVSVVEDTPDTTLIEFHIADPVRGTVRIDGEAWSTMSLGGESIARGVGEPALPDVRRSVMIGSDDAVEANFVRGSYYDIHGIKIAPDKGRISRSIDPATVSYTFGKVYNSAGFWPASIAEVAEPHIIRNVRGVVLTVNPIQWNPASETLRVWTDVTVSVDTVGTSKKNVLDQISLDTHRDNASFEALYDAHFLNYPARRYDALDHTGDMLVICHDPWLANIQPLVDHKNSVGIATDVVGISEIGNTPAAIKSFINSRYASSDLCYVLLVGDAEHISAETAADNGLSDPKYSKLTADDYPDIFLGRFSCQSAADVDTQVERTIAYEQDGWTQRPEYWRAWGNSSTQGPGDDGETDDQHVGNILTQLIEQGYTYTQLITDSGGTVQQGVDLVNSGVGTVAHCGHGSTTCFASGAMLCNGDVDGLTNVEMLPWINSVACVNGEYNAGTCFAEAWMRATHGGAPSGAIGIYASTINQSWAPPMCAQDETYDRYTAETYTTFGVLSYAGSCQMMDEYGSGGVDMFDTWTIFGDPSLVIVGLATPPTGMRVTGSGFAAEGPTGGPFTPDSCEFVLSNHEDAPISFSVSGGAAWLDFGPTSGSIPVGGEVIVSASLNGGANSLPNGLHEITLDFANLDSHDGDATKGISINVGTPVPVLEWDLDSDPGWSMTGEWNFGQPTGQGGTQHGNADPSSGATGSNVIGVNLNGDYSLTVGGPWSLTTSAIDCSNYSDTSVSFQRWLNCDYQLYVIEKFEISNTGSSWTTLWENSSSSEIAENSWSMQEYDISGDADGESTVYLRWTHAIGASGAYAYSGWNIDDIVISAIDSNVSEPCAGDLDGSGDVGTDDLLAVIAGFGCTSGCSSDVTGDGVVNTDDILVVVGAWGGCP
ncbi:MAG: C25 family cysteine peptidase [Phycisphaerales bacterium]|nr:C25 family cysteine peptidase [Phycisphaerales bacterium]